MHKSSFFIYILLTDTVPLKLEVSEYQVFVNVRVVERGSSDQEEELTISTLPLTKQKDKMKKSREQQQCHVSQMQLHTKARSESTMRTLKRERQMRHLSRSPTEKVNKETLQSILDV